MRSRQPEEKMIGEDLCYSKKRAARHLGMGLSKLNELVLLTKAGVAKVEIKFIQFGKGAEVWFPVEELESYKLKVMNAKGRI